MNGKLYQYCGSEAEVLIPQKVEFIWDNAFMGNRTIEKIVIPEGIIGIGYAAFANCVNLKEVSLPEGLTEIPAYCFYNCPKLGPSVSLPKSIQIVDAAAFSQCAGLQIVFIPEKASIGVLAFENCSGMWLINPDVKQSRILYRAFYGCKRLPEELLKEFEKKECEVPVTDISCTWLGLSRLRSHDLVPCGLLKVEDLISHTEEELQQMKNIKPRDIREIKNVLGRLGLSLKGNIHQTETKTGETLSETSGAADGIDADDTMKPDAVVEEDGVMTDSNPISPVILKENVILAGLNNQQYLTYAKKQVVDFFERESWHYREIITRPDLIAWELGMSGDHFTVRMRVAVETDPRVCRIDAILPASVDPVYDAIICKEIIKLNQPLRYGAFQYDESDGQLSYRYSFPTQNGLFSDDLGRVFMIVLLTAKQNFPKLQKYAVGKFTGAEKKQIREYVERLTRELEMDELTL
jgi:hypothetical protein